MILRFSYLQLGSWISKQWRKIFLTFQALMSLICLLGGIWTIQADLEPLWRFLLLLIFITAILATFTKTRWLALHIFHFSGLRLVLEKIHPPWVDKEKKPLSSFAIWALGIYSAMFTIAVTKHEMAAKRIQDRVSNFGLTLSQKDLSPVWREAIEIQKMPCPVQPNFANPITTLESFALKASKPYQPAVDQIKTYFRIRRKDLAGQDLSGANLSGINMAGANFSGAIVENANLIKTNLSGANFERATLTNVSMDEAIFRGANLKIAQLKFCRAVGADFSWADFSFSGIYGVNFEKAYFKETIFRNSEIGSILIYKGPISFFDPHEDYPDQPTKFRTSFRRSRMENLKFFQKSKNGDFLKPDAPANESLSSTIKFHFLDASRTFIDMSRLWAPEVIQEMEWASEKYGQRDTIYVEWIFPQ